MYRYRIAKPQDAARLAEIHHRIKDVNANGIFVMMGKPFLRQYYKLVLSDPCSVCICTENSDRKIIGYTFSILDSDSHQKYLMRHKWRLIGAAVGTVRLKVWLLKDLYSRYKSLKHNDAGFITAHGARGGYWGWDPQEKDSVASCEMHNNMLRIVGLLGIENLHFEVDLLNKQVYRFHKLNGAEVINVLGLPDGRERAFMKYDLNKDVKL